MPDGAKPSSNANWAVIFAGVAVAMGFGNSLWSLANPRGDIDKLEKSFAEYRKEVDWKYVRKDVIDFHLKQIDAALAVAVRREVYDQKVASVDNSISILRSRLIDLDKSVNLTYSSKDFYSGLQSRVLELERALRSPSPAQPKAPQ